MASYTLRIYESDARAVARETEHATKAQARRSLYDYERRHGRRPNDISRNPIPGPDASAQDWDDYRLAHGIAGGP